MLILHVITGLGDGGAEHALFRLCSQSTNIRHAVISLTNEGKYGPLLRAKGITVTELNQRNPLSWVSTIRKLVLIIRQEKPHAVQTWLPHADFIGGIAARVSGIRKIYWSLRATPQITGGGALAKKLPLQILTTMSWFIPQEIISCSEAGKVLFHELGYPLKKIEVIPNGFETQLAQDISSKRAELRRNLSIAPGKKVLGMVARYHPQKDHKNLLEAIKLLSSERQDFVCLLAGKGLDPENNELNQEIRDLGVSRFVILMGQLENTLSFMAGLDLHLISSSWGEGFPNVIGEAMSVGVPNISTDVGDAKMIIGDTGWIVQPRNPVQLAEALSLAISLKTSDLEAIGDRARQRIEDNFSITRMIESFEKVYGQQKILICTRYSNLGASSRVRFGNYVPSLQRSGFTVQRESFFPDEYLEMRYRGVIPLGIVLQSFWRRFSLLWKVRNFDILWVEKEVFPWIPWFLERTFIPRRVKVVADYDDAIHVRYKNHNSPVVRYVLGSKIDHMMRRSDLVLAGSQELAQHAISINASRVALFPSTIDTRRHIRADSSVTPRVAGEKVVVGWIGNPHTWNTYVSGMVPVLRTLMMETDSFFLAVGALEDPKLLAEGWVRFVPWTLATEATMLESIDIGIMPLTDDPWARAKCGYKLLQYMGAAKPVVASPIGANKTIVQHGGNGFLASSHSEWATCLEELIRDASLRRKMGSIGAKTVETEFDLLQHADKLVDHLRDLSGDSKP